MEEIIRRLAIMTVPILFAVTIHEYAHGWVAEKLGDSTPRISGRLTFNPFRHLDLFGTLIFFLTRMFGWAKPIPINPHNFRNYRKGMILVSLAGFTANIFAAIFFGILYRLTYPFGIPYLPFEFNYPFNQMLLESMRINLGLAIFNILPIPPLDGSKVVSCFLPYNLYLYYLKLERFGFIILIFLIVSGFINFISYFLILALKIILSDFF